MSASLVLEVMSDAMVLLLTLKTESRAAIKLKHAKHFCPYANLLGLIVLGVVIAGPHFTADTFVIAMHSFSLLAHC